MSFLVLFYTLTLFSWYTLGQCVFSDIEQYLTGTNYKMKNGKRVPNCVPKSEAYKGAKKIVEKAWKKLKEKK